MKLWLHKIEVIVDRIIPLFVFLLLAIIIIELFLPSIGEQHHTIISIADFAIITIFVLDLIFKYFRIRKIPQFLKTCWLDIVAIFPFFLLFRLVEQAIIIAELSGSVKQFQMLFHEGVEIEKETAKIFGEGSKIAQEAERAGKTSRVKSIIRVFRPVTRSPRLVKALPFYEQPTGLHHLHDPKEDIRKAEREIKKVERGAVKMGRKAEKEIKKVERGAVKIGIKAGRKAEKAVKKEAGELGKKAMKIGEKAIEIEKGAVKKGIKAGKKIISSGAKIERKLLGIKRANKGTTQ